MAKTDFGPAWNHLGAEQPSSSWYKTPRRDPKSRASVVITIVPHATQKGSYAFKCWKRMRKWFRAHRYRVDKTSEKGRCEGDWCLPGTNLVASSSRAHQPKSVMRYSVFFRLSKRVTSLWDDHCARLRRGRLQPLCCNWT